jgi:VanZ family protein
MFPDARDERCDGVEWLTASVDALLHGTGLRQLETGFGAQLPWIALVALVSLVAAVAARHSRPGPLGVHWPAACLAIGSALGIALATLTPHGYPWSPGVVQLVPFHTFRNYLDGYDTMQTMLLYVVGNVVMFLPLGLFLQLALRRWVALTVVLGLLASVSVEVLQLPIWSRSSDVDDVILNTLGTAVGAMLAAVVLRLPDAWRRPRLLFPAEPATVRFGAR